jgi:hypothetical protein
MPTTTTRRLTQLLPLGGGVTPLAFTEVAALAELLTRTTRVSALEIASMAEAIYKSILQARTEVASLAETFSAAAILHAAFTEVAAVAETLRRRVAKIFSTEAASLAETFSLVALLAPAIAKWIRKQRVSRRMSRTDWW